MWGCVLKCGCVLNCTIITTIVFESNGRAFIDRVKHLKTDRVVHRQVWK